MLNFTAYLILILNLKEAVNSNKTTIYAINCLHLVDEYKAIMYNKNVKRKGKTKEEKML